MLPGILPEVSWDRGGGGGGELHEAPGDFRLRKCKKEPSKNQIKSPWKLPYRKASSRGAYGHDLF